MGKPGCTLKKKEKIIEINKLGETIYLKELIYYNYSFHHLKRRKKNEED